MLGLHLQESDLVFSNLGTMLRHNTISIILYSYSHVAPELQEAAASKFDDIVQVRHNESITKTV